MTPAPIGPVRERPSCPVCGKISYSSAGIHPQCAVNRADAKLRLPRKAKKDAAARPGGFSKRCPGCGRSVAARRMVCDCGRAFPSSTLPGAIQESPPLSGVQKMQAVPDRTIDQQVAQRLSSRGINSPCQVTVQTRGGEVTLSGLVQHPHQKNAAVRVATSVMGVRRVIDNLIVKPVVRY